MRVVQEEVAARRNAGPLGRLPQEAEEARGGGTVIYVCDKCLQASCWAGIFMCDESRDAGLYRARKCDLKRLGREHADYMNLPEVVAPRSDTATPMLPRHVFRSFLPNKV